ncbi:MAG: hypothetical protein Q7K55_07410 [Candidatus Levybacteria bacterium]|nr:hypothetical protein [Candidatus Levybacteria bacterium]
MKIIIPMAGLGSRFQKEADKNPEYKKPKPFILIKGKPMIQWALESLPFADLPHRPAQTEMKVYPKDFIFVCRRDHDEEFQVGNKLKEIFTDAITVVFIDKITLGAAETVLAAKKYINSDEDIIVSDSDHYFDGEFLYQKIVSKDKETQGIIPVFRPPDSDLKWSFSLVEKDDVITAVGEKDKELAAKGALANIGGYYFSHGSVYVKEVEEAIRENDLTGDEGKKEFYVAPMYSRLIKKGMKIVAAITPKVWGLGTPKDLEYFEREEVLF